MGPGTQSLHLPYPPTPANAPRLAQAVVDAAARTRRADLDYSPRSLAAVDWIIETFRGDRLPRDGMAEALFCLGCYVGEVIVRRTGARWRNSEGTPLDGAAGAPMVVEFVGGGTCSPIGVVIQRFESGCGDSIVHFYRTSARKHERPGPLRRLFAGPAPRASPGRRDPSPG